MKTIAELQQDIRIIKNEIGNIDKRLDEMNDELTYFKTATSDISEYKRVYEMAKTMPVIMHPIVRTSRIIKNNYFGILLMIATAGDSLNNEQLLFLQRMILADDETNQLDIYIGNLGKITPENVLYQMEECIKNDYSYQLILDSIILMNLKNGVSRGNFELIADISAFLGIKNEELKQICNIAVLVLTLDITKYQNRGNYAVINDNEQYGYYLKNVSGWSECLAKAKKGGSQNNSIAKENEHGDDWFYFESI